MARLLWLADVLRGAGLTVVEYPGWRTRGYDPDSNPYGPIRGIICHATAGSVTSTDEGETRVLWVTGSVTAPAPISQLFLSRTGTWWVGASGRCNHVRLSDVFADSPLGKVGNDGLIGVEAANNNRGEPWPAAMLDSYQRGVAALCRQLGFPAGKALGHREHQYGKTDPYGIDMPRFRLRVADLLAGAFPPVPSTQEDDMKIVLFTYDGRRWRGNLVYRAPLADPAQERDLRHVANLAGITVHDWGTTPVANPDAFGVELTGATSTVGPTLDQIRAVVDEELDEQARGGADND